MAFQAYKKRFFLTTELAHCIGKLGDISIDTTKMTLVLHDGQTVGGIPMARFDHTHPNANGTTAGFLSAADYNIIHNLPANIPTATETIDGLMSAGDKTKLDSIPPGGNNTGGGTGPQSSSNIPNTLVLRDSAGSFSAQNITAAAFIGNLTGNANTVTNGIVSNGSYSNPSWITSLDASKLTGIIPSNVAFSGSISWSSILNRPTGLSAFVNDAGYIISIGSYSNPPWITSLDASKLTGAIPNSVTFLGAASGVQSLGGRETASPNPLTVILRDINGRAQVIDPSNSQDIANKNYVDTQINTVASTPSIGATPNTTCLRDSTGQTNVATPTTSSAAANKGYVDTVFGSIPSSSFTPTPSTLMLRDSNGRCEVSLPVALNDVANKNYVDTQVSSIGGQGTSSPTPSTLMLRDSNGRTQLQDPAAPQDVMTKNYMDAKKLFVGTTAPIAPITGYTVWIDTSVPLS